MSAKRAVQQRTQQSVAPRAAPGLIDVPCDKVKLNPKNARTHSSEQIDKLARNISEFGFLNPIVIDRELNVIAGHGRVRAARKLGLASTPALSVDHLTEEQKRIHAIADNRLAELAGWDDSLLAMELADLSGVDFGIDVTLSGFNLSEITGLIDAADPADTEEEPPIPAARDYSVTSPGDLWTIGSHRLLCGDATDPNSCDRLLGGDKAQAVCTDPPYNVKIEGHVSGLGRTTHREFAMASGEMSESEFKAFLRKVLLLAKEHAVDGSLHYIFMDWRHIRELMDAGESVYSELKNLCVWAKSNAGMGSLYRSQHELVFVYKAGTAPHVNNVSLGKYGRNRTNVWNFPGANSFGKTRDADLAVHPTVKPVALVREAIMDSTRRNDIVLDPFGGSGTTLLAAHQAGRRGMAMEIDPIYCDVIVRRLSALTGEPAILETTGQSFDALDRVLG